MESGAILRLHRNSDGYKGWITIQGERFTPYKTSPALPPSQVLEDFYVWCMKRHQVEIPITLVTPSIRCDALGEHGNSGPGGKCPQTAKWWVGERRFCKHHAGQRRKPID